MAKLTNKQHEQQQDRRVSKLEKRADTDDKIVSKLEKRITALEKQMSNLKAKSK